MRSPGRPTARTWSTYAAATSSFPAAPIPTRRSIPEGVSQNIYVAAVAGGEPRKLGEGYGSAVSPSGDQVAFISHGQIWSADLNSERPKPKQLLHTRGELSGWSGRRTVTPLAFVSERNDHSFIGVYNLHEKTLIYLDASTENDPSPSGRRTAGRSPSYASPARPSPRRPIDRTASPWSIRIADAATGTRPPSMEGRKRKRQRLPRDPRKPSLLWTADNRLVFPWEADGWSHLYSVPISGGTALLLTPGEFEVEDISLTHGSHDRPLYLQPAGHRPPSHLVRARSRRQPKALTSGTGIEVAPIQAGNAIAMLRSDEQTPLRPALLEANGTLRTLSRSSSPPTFPGAKFVKPEQVIFPAADGLKIHGQLFLPATAHDGKRHPAIVFFHGGSRRQMLLGFHPMQYYSNSYAMNQYLASLGYIVLSVNYRSGIGYGLNFREALNYGRGGASEYNDILGAGKYLRSRADVDSKRIGVWGGSYGGFMTALALARASDIFAAGVDMHGVHEWLRPPAGSPPTIPIADAKTSRHCGTRPHVLTSPPGARRFCSSRATTTATFPSCRP